MKLYTNKAILDLEKLFIEKPNHLIQRIYDKKLNLTIVMSADGCKTYVIKPYGVHTDGRSLYRVRKYNKMPQKYAF